MKAVGQRAVMVALLGMILGAGCSGLGPTTFVHPDFNFGFTERVAVVPFENLSRDQGAGARATRYFTAELLAAEAFDVVEPGQVSLMLQKEGVTRTADLGTDQIIALGRSLGVQALFLGSLGESDSQRSGSANVVHVTLNVRMVETEKGVTVWSTTHTEGGRGFWATLFGAGTKSRSEVTRRCVSRCLSTLVN